jgi:DNA-binding LytR/AlgR family response regulator
VLKDLTDVRFLDVAQTPADAISLIAKHELDWQLLILDIDLRNGSGFDVMRDLSKRLPHQQVFVLTIFLLRAYEAATIWLTPCSRRLDKFFDRCKNFQTLSHLDLKSQPARSRRPPRNFEIGKFSQCRRPSSNRLNTGKFRTLQLLQPA